MAFVRTREMEGVWVLTIRTSNCLTTSRLIPELATTVVTNCPGELLFASIVPKLNDVDSNGIQKHRIMQATPKVSVKQFNHLKIEESDNSE